MPLGLEQRLGFAEMVVLVECLGLLWVLGLCLAQLGFEEVLVAGKEAQAGTGQDFEIGSEQLMRSFALGRSWAAVAAVVGVAVSLLDLLRVCFHS